MRAWRAVVLAVVLASTGWSIQTVGAQAPGGARLAILQAEMRLRAGASDAASTRDLALLRNGVRAQDVEAARAAVRALGRLHRPDRQGDIVPALTAQLPEVRAEAAHAVAESLAGSGGSTAPAVERALGALLDRLDAESEASVRAALGESIGRLPYASDSLRLRAERALVSLSSSEFALDRLGAAKGFEALARSAGNTPLSSASTAALTFLAAAHDNQRESNRDAARVRRLAMEALLRTGRVGMGTVAMTAGDTDAQVRRLAMMGAAAQPAAEGVSVLRNGLNDESSLVRIAALRGLDATERGGASACQAAMNLSRDPELPVAAASLDLLSACGALPGVAAYLEDVIGAPIDRGSSRSWQAPARALAALARVDAERGRAMLRELASTGDQPRRLAAAHVAAAARDSSVLDLLGQDADEAVRAAARIRDAQPDASEPAFAPGAASGGATPGDAAARQPDEDLDGAELRRLAAPRARVTIRDVGTFELALFSTEAPMAVLRFAHLAEAKFFVGAVIDQAEPASVDVVPAAGRDAGAGLDGLYDEHGSWPHVRGSVGLVASASGDNHVFITLVDSPAYDHERTVFAQVLNGADVLDRLIEGDVIESVEILP